MILKRKHSDVFGQAALDYLNGNKKARISVTTNISFKEYIQAAYLFRTYTEMDKTEQMALDSCKGTVLDIGAGTGCHALELQNRGFEVFANEKSELLCKVMHMQGIKNIMQTDLWELDKIKADTVLLMMNNIGIAGTLDNLPGFLMHIAGLLNNDGQILATSSDISYLFEYGPLDFNTYYGELIYTMKYKWGNRETFPWLFIDPERLESLMQHIGLKMEMLYSDNAMKKYLVRITKS